MTQIKTIIAEIERLYNEEAERFDTSQEIGAKRILDKLSNFINFLPAEQPSEEFKEEFNNFCVHGDIRNPNFEGPFGYDDIRKTAIHFAQWQKEQMMKSAVDATCVLLPPPDLFKVLICHDVTNNLSKGQKVKIITVTVKEDEQ